MKLTDAEQRQQDMDGSAAIIDSAHFRIAFQLGPVKEVGRNGCQMEDILEVVEARLKGFQAGKFACRENALELTKIQEAIHWLRQRTADREKRGFEGKNEK